MVPVWSSLNDWLVSEEKRHLEDRTLTHQSSGKKDIPPFGGICVPKKTKNVLRIGIPTTGV